VPESRLLAVEWFLPTFDIIPEHKAFKHIKARKTVEPVAMPPAEAQRLYNAVIAQIAVRTVREVFAITPPDMVSNGGLQRALRHTVHPATGRKIQPPLISMRATRESSTYWCSPNRASTQWRPSSGTSLLPSPSTRRSSSR
jgi:restriction system protein